MEDCFKDLQAWCWRYTENVSNYPGLHFTAKPASCDVLIAFLQRLQEAGGKRTVPLLPLDSKDEAKITGGQRFLCFHKLRIEIEMPSDRLRQMSFREVDGIVHFHFTRDCLTEFLQGLANVHDGHGDYAIEPCELKRTGMTLGQLDRQSECLWFWPCFGHFGVDD